MKYLRKHWWETIFICLLILGFTSGILGFIEANETKHKLVDSLYETFRLFERKYHSKDIPSGLRVAQWLLFFAFLWLSLKIIITIIAPNFLSDIWVRYSFRKHIVICGLNEITLLLVSEYKDRKIIVLAEEYNKYAESLKIKGVKFFLCGDLSDKAFLRKARIKTASLVYVVTENDKKNVEITRSISALLKKGHYAEALKCYTLIKDRELKILLEESALFKYRTEFLDPALFNINETGIKYGLNTNIDKILPENRKVAPSILVIGLTEKAEAVFLNLAHCMTMKREFFRFTIAEEDPEKIRLFKKKYPYLPEFTEIDYTDNGDEVCKGNRFSSVFICLDNQIEAVKTALSIRCLIADNLPNILIISGESENWIEVFNEEEIGILTLKNRNIFLVDILEETIRYLVKSDPEIERLAEIAHNHWREKDEQGNYTKNDEYNTISGHLKQTNRNQIADNYLRTFIATGQKLGTPKRNDPVVFSGEDRETLAMMEHRRWMLEKYSNGWHSGGKRNDDFKIQNNLVSWGTLTEKEKEKDFVAIDLMTNMINS
ncbi:MAG: NAD-binding protein [Tannerella sp.]|jgi:hypothetical protein|nr:NAD-binding protein [Tannerella sp.]